MAASLLCLVAFIAVLSQFGKVMSGMIGIPNVLPLVRDGLLIVLVLVALARTDIFKARGFFIAALLYVLLLVVNIGVAAMDGRHFAGVYYARLYLLPLLSAVAIRGLIMSAPDADIRRMVRTVFWCGLFIIVSAFGIFVAIEINPPLVYTMMGGIEGQQLATAWYIAGGTWLRMGLPAVSPNSLGLILAFYLLLLVPLMMDGRYIQMRAWTRGLVILLTVLAMAMSFSRSSWIALLLGGGVIFALCHREWGIGSASGLMKVAGVLGVMGVLIGAALVAVDGYSGGFISQWLDLNKSGTDPSMVGHGESFTDALAAIDDYFWLGYPKGTVSARAMLFGEEINNVENSIIAAFFDMGVPLGMVFLVLVGCLLRGLWVHKSQWGMLAAFSFCCMFLPYVFEPDIIALFMTCSVLLGRALQRSAEIAAAPGGGVDIETSPEPRGPKSRRARRLADASAFQATVFETR